MELSNSFGHVQNEIMWFDLIQNMIISGLGVTWGLNVRKYGEIKRVEEQKLEIFK